MPEAMKLPDVSLLKTLTQGPEARALEKARGLVAEGKLDKAIAALEACLARGPESEPLLFELSRCMLSAKRDADAGECLKKILRRTPGRIDAVLEFIEETRLKGRDVGTCYDALAEHYVRQEDFARALDALERISPEELRVYQGRQQARWDAVRRNAPAAKLTRTSLHSAYYVALSLERMADYGKAAQAYRSLIEKNPEETGRICSRFESILARDYRNLPLRFALVDLLLQTGKREEALAQMEQAMEADAESAAPDVASRLEAVLEKQPGGPEPGADLRPVSEARGDSRARTAVPRRRRDGVLPVEGGRAGVRDAGQGRREGPLADNPADRRVADARHGPDERPVRGRHRPLLHRRRKGGRHHFSLALRH